MKDRLQFRFHRKVFDTREQAIDYIKIQIRFTEEGMAATDPSYGYSLLGEPTVLLYKNVTETDPTGELDPHLMLVIGSATNSGTQYSDNRFCFIDVDKTESEIMDLQEEIEKVIKGLTLVVRDSDTLKLYTTSGDSGVTLSGDVSVARAQIFENVRLPNRIMTTEEGLYTYVNLKYDEENEKFVFYVSNAETGEIEKTTVKLGDNYLVSGTYSVEDESLHLVKKDGTEIVISLENLIDEWDVEGEASKTPIVLTKEEVGYGNIDSHSHVEPWQDVLRADIRLADMTHNILKKTSDGRYLYVNGMTDNIWYFSGGSEVTVTEVLNDCIKRKISSDNSNIMQEKPDGFFVSATLKYLNRENTLVFTTSNVTGGTTTETIKLNSVELFKEIYYDSVTEELVILYVDDKGDVKAERIPIGEMLMNWEWDIVNDGHNVKLHKQRVVGGSDKVSADVDILVGHDNILEDSNHQLYVKGTADNIKYGDNSTVKAEIDRLSNSSTNINTRLNEVSGKVDTLSDELDAEVERSIAEDESLNEALNAEISRSTEKDEEHDSKITTIEETIGSGFTTYTRETVTYKFNELSDKVDAVSSKTESITSSLEELSAKTEDEIARATSEEERIEKKFDEALGEGFDLRNTVRDEFDREKSAREAADNLLSGAIESLSSVTDGKLVDIINEDHSINVDKSDAVRPVIKVNLSTEIEDSKPNIIKLNNDGLYAGVDLEYTFDEITGSNQLIFKTTNGTKVYDLKTNSVVDKIYYDPAREAIIIEYTVNGHRMPDVVVPVGDLINEWRIWDGHEGAVQLEKLRVPSGSTEKDVLKASVVISDSHDDNIVINDGGALYVSGKQISDNKDAINALEVRVDTIEHDVETISSDVETISSRLESEITRSAAKDEVLENDLESEVSRSTEKDLELQTAIDNEKIRALSAETELRTSAATIANSVSNLSSSVASDVARLDAKDVELEDKIDTIDETYLINVLNTNTISLVKEEASKGYNIKASVEIDDANDNVIKETANGIYSTVDLTYDETTNRLTFSTTNGSKEIALVSNSIVDKVYYDAVNETIVIEYTVNGQRQEDVVVPVRDLINEIDVADTNTIELIKTAQTSTGPDVITANVKLNTYHNDNIIINDGGLYVSGAQIEANKNDIATVSGQVVSETSRAMSVESGLNESLIENTNAIANEVIRAISAESVINNSLTSEIDRANREEGRIEGKIDAEILRSTNKDYEHDTKIAEHEEEIADEIQRAKDVENALNSSIVTNNARALNEESRIDAKVTSEIARSTSEDARIDAKIDNEISRAQTAESVLNDKIDAVDAKTFTLSVDDTTTVDMSFENDVLKSNVIIANGNNNIIKATSNSVDGGGLFASVDLEYNAATNKLKLITSSAEKEVALSMGSIIKSIEYDSVAKNLIIRYDVNTAGEIHEETVFVPVEDLFNDWVVQQGEHLGAIILHKSEGTSGNPDVLSAEVVISVLNDNMLVNDQGSLYVSSRPIDEVREDLVELREDFEGSLGVEDTDTLHLERTANNVLRGNVRLDVADKNLIKSSENGIIFDGDMDCGEYV